MSEYEFLTDEDLEEGIDNTYSYGYEENVYFGDEDFQDCKMLGLPLLERKSLLNTIRMFSLIG